MSMCKGNFLIKSVLIEINWLIQVITLLPQLGQLHLWCLLISHQITYQKPVNIKDCTQIGWEGEPMAKLLTYHNHSRSWSAIMLAIRSRLWLATGCTCGQSLQGHMPVSWSLWCSLLWSWKFCWFCRAGWIGDPLQEYYKREEENVEKASRKNE